MEQSIFQKLVDQLMQLITTYEQLLSIAQEKKVSIIQNQIEEVNSATMKESKIIKNIPNFETEIRGYMTAIQRELGFRPKLKATISELVRLITNPKDKLLLSDIQKKLTAVTADLQYTNELNQKLIQQSLEYVNFSLDVMCGPEDEEVTYQKPSLQQQAARRSGIYNARL